MISQKDNFSEVQSSLSKKYQRVVFIDDQIPWFAICDDGKFGVSNICGEIIIHPTRYTFVFQCTENDCLYYLVRYGKYEGICDSKGVEVIAPSHYTKIYPNCQDGIWYYSVQDGDNIGICDMTGTEIVHPGQYSSIELFKVNDYGFFYVKSDDKQGVVDMTGKTIIPPQKYSHINLRDKYGIWFYFEVKRGTYCGICNLDGEEVVPTSFQNVKSNEKGTGFKVSNNYGEFADYHPEIEFIGSGYELYSNGSHNYRFNKSRYALPLALSLSHYHHMNNTYEKTETNTRTSESSTDNSSQNIINFGGMPLYTDFYVPPTSEFQYPPIETFIAPSTNGIYSQPVNSESPNSTTSAPLKDYQYIECYKGWAEQVSDNIRLLSHMKDSYAETIYVRSTIRDGQKEMRKLRMEAAKYGIIIQQSPMETISY